MRVLFKFILLIFVYLIVLNSSYSFSVEQFTKYDTTIIINEDDTITVEKIINLRNIHTVGIIPGQFEFQLNSASGNPLDIISYDVLDRYNNKISSQLIETKDKTAIILNLITPILPGFEQVIKLSYKIKYEPSGIFFKRVEMPLKESTRVPILDGEVRIEIPSGKSFTYISNSNQNVSVDSNSATFLVDQNSPSTLEIEYSFLPLRVGNIPGSLLFWTIINIILILILAYEVKREVEKIKKRRK